MPNLGGPEMIILLVVLLLLFGASRLPKLARSIGEARKELRDAVAEEDH
jgi:sec-independent protein translocase protein TatA